jgi:hypothetical protein
MSLTATRPTEVSATVSLWVSRGEAGDLQDGVRGVLDGVDGVEDVVVHEVTDVRPTWTDIRVTADVDLRMTAESTADEEALCEQLREGFGVTGVEALTTGQ